MRSPVSAGPGVAMEASAVMEATEFIVQHITYKLTILPLMVPLLDFLTHCPCTSQLRICTPIKAAVHDMIKPPLRTPARGDALLLVVMLMGREAIKGHNAIR